MLIIHCDKPEQIRSVLQVLKRHKRPLRTAEIVNKLTGECCARSVNSAMAQLKEYKAIECVARGTYRLTRRDVIVKPRRIPAPPRAQLARAMQKLRTQRAVAAHYSISTGVVRRWCREYGIPNPPRGRHTWTHEDVLLSEEAIELIDGLIASDGNIAAPNIHSAVLRVSTPFKAYAQAVVDAANSVGLPMKLFRSRNSKSNASYYKRKPPPAFTYHATTPNLPALIPHRVRWYGTVLPCSRKRVPGDFRSTSLSWKWIYVGDGSIHQHKTFTPRIELYTAFSLHDTERLLRHLWWCGVDGAYAREMRSLGHFHIRIGRKEEIARFLAFIGGPPCAHFEYKWKYETLPVVACLQCGEPFQLTTTRHRGYCSNACRRKAARQ